MIAGPSVYICDECVDLSNEILEEELPTRPGLRTPEEARPEIEPRDRSAPLVPVTTGPSTEVTIPPKLEDELTRLWNDFKNYRTTRDMSALPALLEHYQPLADHYVDGLVIDREVFAREAHRALVNSIVFFDERRGEPFETVVLEEIQRAIYGALVVALELPRDRP